MNLFSRENKIKSNLFCYVNDNILLEEEAFISINERAFLLGDSIFETILVKNNLIYNFRLHYKRLLLAANKLQFKTDEKIEFKKLLNACYNLIKTNQISNGVLRISLSRGKGSLGYLPKYDSPCLLVIQYNKLRYNNQDALSLGIFSKKLDDQKILDINFKSSQSLKYIMAKIEASDKNLSDNILLSRENNILETSSSNIFLIIKGKIYTPSLKQNLIAGTTREIIVRDKKFDIYQKICPLEYLKKAEEIFVTNSILISKSVSRIVIKDKIIDLRKFGYCNYFYKFIDTKLRKAAHIEYKKFIKN